MTLHVSYQHVHSQRCFSTGKNRNEKGNWPAFYYKQGRLRFYIQMKVTMDEHKSKGFAAGGGGGRASYLLPVMCVPVCLKESDGQYNACACGMGMVDFSAPCMVTYHCLTYKYARGDNKTEDRGARTNQNRNKWPKAYMSGF